ncbi:MAG: outer membrane murein-binding lipoprotein Lpp [Parvicella sp.]|jgi:outer membrane murein-binding lipoprotein Lpp
MSKKVKIIGGVVAVIVAVVLYLVLTGGGASAEDIDTGKEVAKELENVVGQDNRKTDAVADSLDAAVDLGEFDAGAEFE